MTTPSQNERAARILGWKSYRRCTLSPTGYYGYAPDDPFPHDKGIVAAPDFTGPTLDYEQLIAHAQSNGWHCTLDNSKGWACIFWKTDAKERSATDCEGSGETLQSAVCAAFLAAFEPEHPAA